MLLGKLLTRNLLKTWMLQSPIPHHHLTNFCGNFFAFEALRYMIPKIIALCCIICSHFDLADLEFPKDYKFKAVMFGLTHFDLPNGYVWNVAGTFFSRSCRLVGRWACITQLGRNCQWHSFCRQHKQCFEACAHQITFGIFYHSRAES